VIRHPATYRDHVVEDELVTSAEAAKRLGISPRTLQRWAKDGLVQPELRLPHGQLRWNVADLRRQIKALGQRESE
jgi:DNA-binding transcriptional MerR regulator